MKENKQLKEDAAHQELVWIELVRTEGNDAKNQERAAKLNQLFGTLCGGRASWTIEWSKHSQRYHKVDSCGSFLVLEDDGHFFNLDYLGRPPAIA